MKPDELAHVLAVLADRGCLKVLLEVYRRRGREPYGLVTLAEICEATGLTRGQAVNCLGRLTGADLLGADRSAWDKRLFFLTNSDLRGMVVEACRLLEGGPE